MASCSLSARAWRWGPAGGPAWRGVTPLGTLEASIPESSGLAPSARTPGAYWTLNDSGNDADLFAIDSAGRVLSRVRLDGVDNGDWEALGTGPCPQGTCLYVGDVGDNFSRRPAVRLLRVPEPDVAAMGRRGAVAPGEVERLTLRYPDGARDVEALFVAPDTAVWLVTKRPDWLAVRARPARLYRIPPAAWRAAGGGGAVAEPAGRLPVVPGRRNAREWITDAALSPPRPEGTRRLAVLTYGTIHLFEADARTGRPGRRVGRCALPIREHDPEAIAWRPDGSLLLTNEGTRSTVYAGWCP